MNEPRVDRRRGPVPRLLAMLFGLLGLTLVQPLPAMARSESQVPFQGSASPAGSSGRGPMLPVTGRSATTRGTPTRSTARGAVTRSTAQAARAAGTTQAATPMTAFGDLAPDLHHPLAATIGHRTTGDTPPGAGIARSVASAGRGDAYLGAALGRAPPATARP